ncbi:MAG: hypothetical protein ACOCP8_07795 [archaeon]
MSKGKIKILNKSVGKGKVITIENDDNIKNILKNLGISKEKIDNIQIKIKCSSEKAYDIKEKLKEKGYNTEWRTPE